MDEIWNGNPQQSWIIGRYDRDEKTNDHAEPTQSNAKQNKRTTATKVHD